MVIEKARPATVIREPEIVERSALAAETPL
jgi:hypothetical protein